MSGGSRGLFDDVDDSKLTHKERYRENSSLFRVLCVRVFPCGLGQPNSVAMPTLGELRNDSDDDLRPVCTSALKWIRCGSCLD